MREVLILWAGRHEREPWRSLCGDYASRIGHHWRLEQRMVRSRERNDAKRRRWEADALAAAAPQPAMWLALDSRGKARTSEAFAGFLARSFEGASGPLVFLVGSDLGLHEELLSKVHGKISFGPMTLPHEMARLVLLEQLYRALAIETGIKYHREPF
jgi:23S rRNA (pseudouridine1915-N3)-methyltransferase